MITEYDHAAIKCRLQIKCVQNEKSAYLQMQSKTFMRHTRHFWILNNRNVKLVVGDYWWSATWPNPSVCSWASCDMIIKACSAVGNNCFEISSFVINTTLNSTCCFLWGFIMAFVWVDKEKECQVSNVRGRGAYNTSVAPWTYLDPAQLCLVKVLFPSNYFGF